MSEIRIYFEGDPKLKPGFHAFFAEIVKLTRGQRIGFRLVAGRSTEECRKDFQSAKKSHGQALNLLLVDSEGPAKGPPAEDQYLMIEVMESWFLADPEQLAAYFGEGFQQSALRSVKNVETVPKQDVFKGLHEASKKSRKRSYEADKAGHACEILGIIDPRKVCLAARECNRLFTHLRQVSQR